MNIEEFPIVLEKNKRAFKLVTYFFLGILVLILIVIAVFYFFFKDSGDNTGERINKTLPGDLIAQDSGLNDEKLRGIKAEDIMFGHFYEKPRDDFRPSATAYPLPADVKVQAENYYDVNRKIDLSNHVEALNKKGFKIVDNPYKDADDFFSLYNKLLSEDIPVIVTSDFLMYFYQNNLKNVFDEIERNTFYENIWDIYKDIYEVAKDRYVERLARLGVSNDPILEGQRLETAYLAVVLKLLSPSADQITEQKSLNSFSKFTKAEASRFDFNLPPFLEKDVEDELHQIKRLKTIARSPVLLYARDYADFKIPAELNSDAKLHNFYLATKWLNSLFPLYFRTDDCKQCLLDKNDWLINLASASYLAKDMSDNQANKNRWAIIYKFIAYFNGLRQDLTYLEYDRAMKEIYGEGYVIENIFSRKEFNDIDIYKIQAKIAENKFSEIEGSYSRKEGKNPLIGMRMLQEDYWPNDYIFDRLTGKKMITNATSLAKREQKTICTNYRCNGTAMDILNLQVPLSKNANFTRESNYQLYNQEVQNIRDYMQGFNVFTWNTNIYWSSLDIIYTSLKEDRSAFPSYMRGDEWFDEKEVNSALGAWTNIHVPKDTVTTKLSEQEAFTSMRPICDLPNFVEPKIDFLNENIARNKMLLDMMDVLNVSRQSNLAALDIEDVNTKFERIIEIDKKLLSGTLMNYSDCSYIEGLVGNKMISEGSGSKSFKIRNSDNVLITEKLNGVKLLIAMFTHGGDNIIAMGPVFDYTESISKR